MKRYDAFDYEISDFDKDYYYRYYSKPKPKDEPDNPVTVKRLHLFWDFRYANGSYKARKAGISSPSVMMKYKNDRFRLYGKPENNKLFEHCKDILKGWKARNKAEIKALKAQRV